MSTSNNVGTFSIQRQGVERIWWPMLRALRDGTDAMRAEGALFTPPDWRELRDRKVYLERLSRTFLFNAYDKAVQTLASKPFQKAMQVSELPAPLEAIEYDADRSGLSLTMFASQLYEDRVDRGFAVFIVDHVRTLDDQGAPVSLAQELQMGARPYFARIAPDNLIACDTQVVDGREVVTHLRYKEIAYRSQPDYSQVTVERVWVWTMDTVELWEKEVATTSQDPVEQVRLQNTSRSGHALISSQPHGFPGPGLPIVLVGKLWQRPPLLNLAWLNVQHWQSSSQQAWALHYARAAILRGKGMTRDEVEKGISLGAGAVALSSSPDFDLAYVEVSGAALTAGKEDLAQIEARMVQLGMAPLTESSGPQTATGELRVDMQTQSDAQRWAEELEWAIYRAYEMAAAWRRMELPDTFNVSIFRDFALVAGRTGDIAALQADATAGRITAETYLAEAKRRGLYGDDLDPASEAELAGSGMPEPVATPDPVGAPS
mgnify:FL=1